MLSGLLGAVAPPYAAAPGPTRRARAWSRRRQMLYHRRMSMPAETAAIAPAADPLMNFVKEYKVADVSVCDRLIDFFKICRGLNLTGPGLTGNYQVNKKVKDSEDLAVESLPKTNPLIPSPEQSGYG